MRKILFTNLFRRTNSSLRRGTLFYSSTVSNNHLLVPNAIELEVNSYLQRLLSSEDLYETRRNEFIREIKKDIKIGELLLEKYDVHGAKALFKSLLIAIEKSKINDKTLLSQIHMNYGLALKHGDNNDTELAKLHFQKVIEYESVYESDYASDAMEEIKSINYHGFILEKGEKIEFIDESTLSKHS